MNRTASSSRPSSMSPPTTCSLFENSWAWARNACASSRTVSSSRNTPSSSVRSRSVTTAPTSEPRIVTGRRFTTSVRSRASTTWSRPEAVPSSTSRTRPSGTRSRGGRPADCWKGVREVLRELRVEEADRNDADHPVAGHDRDLRADRAPERALLVPDVHVTGERAARIGRDALADVLRVGVRIPDAVLVRDDDEVGAHGPPDRLGDRLDRLCRVRLAHRLPDVRGRRDRVRDREGALLVLVVDLRRHERL